MKCVELQKDFYYVGVVDHALKVFDVAVLTDYGTSYNSYLLKTDEGVVVFEGNKAVTAEEYLDHIRSIARIEDIRYLVVTHTEPDHSGAIESLLELNPQITVIASAAALMNLDKILRKPFNRKPMTPNGTMNIGQYTFRFISGMLLHWPDVMFTYIEELKVLVSCDAFGAHFASDEILLSKEPDKEGYYKALKYYYDHIIGPFPSYVIQACDRVSALDIKMICPGHGPVIDDDIKKQIEIYRSLAEPSLPKNDPNHVTIVFASAYGYTRKMAEYFKERFEKDGKQVSFFEISALNYAEVKPQIYEEIRTSGLVLLGSPTLVGDAIVLFYDLLNGLVWPLVQGKKAAAFGDYGWSGEAVKNLSERLAQLKFNVIPGFRYAFKLDEQGEKELAEFYDRLAA